MENNNGNCNLHTAVIIGLLVVIAVLGFFLGKNYNPTTTVTPIDSTDTTTVDSTKGTTSDIIFYVIGDKRCTSCPTDDIITQLKLMPALANLNIEQKDFADKGVEAYLKDNNITKLPAFIFNSNNVDAKINEYLEELPSKEYSLQAGSTFDPFAERSEKGFLVIEKEKINEIIKKSYIKGNTEAKITWLEYSDLECPFCAKLHTSGTPEELTEKYGDDLRVVYNHFPLDFHKNAVPGAQIMECVGELSGGNKFYDLLDVAYGEGKSDKEFLIDEAVKLGVNKTSLEKCFGDNEYEAKITSQQKAGADLFGITGTPGNVLINNETGEYEVISGAYPTESFVSIIDKLLK